MPRITRSIRTPAWLASYNFSIKAGSTTELSLAQIAPGRPAADMGDLGLDMGDDVRPHVARRHRDQLERARLDIAGDIIEDVGDIAADPRIGGEETEIGVDARRDRVIIAGAEVAIGAIAALLAPHDHRHLRVRLPLDETVDDLDAGALQRARPHQISVPRRSAPSARPPRSPICPPRPPGSAR